MLRQNVQLPNKNVSGWYSLPVDLGNDSSESNAGEVGENENAEEEREGGENNTNGPI